MNYDHIVVKRRRIISPSNAFFSQGATEWAPSDVSGLLAWYKADTGVTGSPITAVEDQSTNNIDLTNTGTVPFSATGFNGFPAFDFQATGGLRSTSNAVAMGTGTTGSAFAVGKMLTGTENNGRLISYVATGQTEDWENNGSANWIGRNLTNNAFDCFRNAVNPTQAISLNTNYRFGMIFDGANVTPYVNNVAGTPAACSFAWGSPGTIGIGINAVGGPARWYGPVAEVVITNNVISSDDRNSLDAYFVSRFGP